MFFSEEWIELLKKASNAIMGNELAVDRFCDDVSKNISTVMPTILW